MGICVSGTSNGRSEPGGKYAPRLLSQSHLSYEDLNPPPPEPPSTIDWDLTTATYAAQDVASSTRNRRSQNLRKILATEIHSQKLDTDCVSGAHVDSLHHQKKLKSVAEYFAKRDKEAGESPRRLAHISVAELERVVADAGIGEVLFAQTLAIEGMPLTKKQRRRKNGAKLGSELQRNRIMQSLSSAYGVLLRHVKVLEVREGLAVKKTRWLNQGKKKRRSLLQRKPARAEIDYEITTPDGPPCDNLEALQRGLGRRSRDDEMVQKNPEDSDSSSSDDDSGSDYDSSDSGSSGDESDSDEEGGRDRSSEAREVESVTSEYTGGLVEKLAIQLSTLISADVGIMLEKNEEDITKMAGATVPNKSRLIKQDGFLTRRAALVDAFGSYLHNRETIHRGERRIHRKRKHMQKVTGPVAVARQPIREETSSGSMRKAKSRKSNYAVS